jgi:hypothetical protein
MGGFGLPSLMLIPQLRKLWTGDALLPSVKQPALAQHDSELQLVATLTGRDRHWKSPADSIAPSGHSTGDCAVILCGGWRQARKKRR